MAKKKTVNKNVKYVVMAGGWANDDYNALVFDSLKEVEDYYREAVENDDMDVDDVEDIQVLEVNVVKSRSVYVDKRYEISVGCD